MADGDLFTDHTPPTAPAVAGNPVALAPGTVVVESIVEGTGITVDDTDPANPIIAASA